MNSTSNNTRPVFMEAEPASYETPEFTLDDLEAEFRRVLGDDAVDRINNPVGMALEDAARREKYNTPYDNWGKPLVVSREEAVLAERTRRKRAENNGECEMCPSRDFADDSILCCDC